MLQEIWNNLKSIDFWLNLLNSFKGLGPLAPIILAAIESIIPPLPLVAIVLVNVAAHGIFLGFLYSWVGTCVGCTIVFLAFRHFFRDRFMRFSDRHPKVLKARKWVEQTNAATLYMVALFPLTPSAFENFAFGVSEFSRKKYLITLYGAKLIMISLLAIVGQSAVSAIQNPWFILISIGILVVTYILSKKITKMKIDHVNNKEAEKTDDPLNSEITENTEDVLNSEVAENTEEVLNNEVDKNTEDN